MNIYVGNLPYSVDEYALRSMFEEYGEVDTAKVITDRDSGRPKGFAFVEMPNNTEAQAAINALDGKMIEGDRGARAAKVNEARPRKPRRSRDW